MEVAVADCVYPDCQTPATLWVVRRLPDGYLPNPDTRAYCDDHRSWGLHAATQGSPVSLAVDVLEIDELLG
jgi:hypothetical protein